MILVPTISKETFLKTLHSGSKKSNIKNIQTQESKDNHGGPEWVKKDFSMKPPKHWDQDDEDDEEHQVL